MADNTCICCGRIIPEGRHICLHCASENDMQQFGARAQTNADIIRNMNNDELARFLTTVQLMETTGQSKNEEEWRAYVNRKIGG